MRHLVKLYGAEKAALSIDGLTEDEFLARLLHAAVYRLGIAIELVQDAIRHALRLGSGALTVEHFAAAFAARTGSTPDRNVFSATSVDWPLIDPRRGLHRDDPAKIEPNDHKTKIRTPRDVRNK